MPASDFYFCYDPHQTLDTGHVTISIVDKAYYDEHEDRQSRDLYQEVIPCLYQAEGYFGQFMENPEKWLEYMDNAWEEESNGDFTFEGEIAAAVGILRRAGFIEKQNLLVPFNQPEYTSIDADVCEQAARDFLVSYPTELEQSLQDVLAIHGEGIVSTLAAAMAEELAAEEPELPTNPFTVQGGITPNMSTADILSVARQRMAENRREYEQQLTSQPVNVDITKVSRYDSDWDKSVIFKGFSFRLVLRDEDSVIRRMNLLLEVQNKISGFLDENDYIVQTNDDTDELEVYLKSTRAIIVWKMEDPNFFSSRVERIEQHEG